MRLLCTLILCSLGCASTSQPALEEPEAEDDPCVAPTGFATLWDTPTSKMTRDAECVAKQRADAQAELERQYAEQAKQAKQQQEAFARVEAERQTQQQLDDQIAAAARAEQQDEEDLRVYRIALDVKECDTWKVDRRRYEVLAQYQRSPERDKAIAFLEGCRKDYTRSFHREGKKWIAEERTEFALDLEDAFDDANPYGRRGFFARVDGSVLKVSMKGGFEGRARHSQGELEFWCELGAAEVFSKIVLKNRHGTFSCIPYDWPGSAKKLLDALLEDVGAANPLSTEAGPKPVPAEVETSPAAVQAAAAPGDGQARNPF